MKEMVQMLPGRIDAGTLGYFTTVVHSETLESDSLDIELGAILTESADFSMRLSGERLLKVRTLRAEAKMATVVRVGGFEKNCESYGAIGLWVEENGYRINGPGREVLIQPPRTERFEEMVTEIQFPIEHDNKTADTDLAH
jgi:effector-binding domain-containing protein